MPDIISQPTMRLGKLSESGEGALDCLVQQRRCFNRLDWWSPHEWLGSDAFCAVSAENAVGAAALIVPVAFEQINQLHSARSRAAWLRWCAVADGVSASGVLRHLLPYCAEQACDAGIERIYAIVEASHWFTTYLREEQYRHVDDVITMICHAPESSPVVMPLLQGVRVRAAMADDITEAAAVDHSAFDEKWQYPLFVLRRALGTSAYFSVAAREKQIVGYQFATSDGQDAHITRLAVRTEWQGNGVGAALLEDALDFLLGELGMRHVTLNTQASNQVSQRLYKRFGFQVIPPSMKVLCRQLGK